MAYEEKFGYIRKLIQVSKDVIKNFDEKGIKPKHYVIAGLIEDVSYAMNVLIEKRIEYYENEKKDVAHSEEEKSEIEYIISESKKDKNKLRECLSGLFRVHKHVGIKRK